MKKMLAMPTDSLAEQLEDQLSKMAIDEQQRKVYNRAKRLVRLIELGAPDIIIFNEMKFVKESSMALSSLFEKKWEKDKLDWEK